MDRLPWLESLWGTASSFLLGFQELQPLPKLPVPYTASAQLGTSHCGVVVGVSGDQVVTSGTDMLHSTERRGMGESDIKAGRGLAQPAFRAYHLWSWLEMNKSI